MHRHAPVEGKLGQDKLGQSGLGQTDLKRTAKTIRSTQGAISFLDLPQFLRWTRCTSSPPSRIENVFDLSKGGKLATLPVR